MSIIRHHTRSRMSQIVIHKDIVYLAGQVATDSSANITIQTQQILATIDDLLAEAGTDKTRILTAQVWLASIGHVTEMNKVWDTWIPEGNAPARACIEARLVSPDYLVEIGVIAAI